MGTVLLVQAIAFAVLTGISANRKERSVGSWAAIGFFFGVFGFVASLLVEDKSSSSAISSSRSGKRSTSPRSPRRRGSFDPEDEDKKCPDCAERIKLEATVCRFCGHEFDEEEVQEQVDEAKEAYERREKHRRRASQRQSSNSGRSPNTCPTCGSQYSPGQSKCSQCGTSL